MTRTTTTVAMMMVAMTACTTALRDACPKIVCGRENSTCIPRARTAEWHEWQVPPNSSATLVDDLQRCDWGLFCHPEHRKCVPQASYGKACPCADGCIPGAACQDGKCVQVGTTTYRCDYSVECSREKVCKDGMCVEGERAGDGCKCDGLANVCKKGLFCGGEGANRTCRRPAAEGGACASSDYGCQRGLQCFKGKCCLPMFAKEGEECETSLNCREGLACGHKRKCVKGKTGIAQHKKCEADEECPDDSWCSCDVTVGARQCMTAAKCTEALWELWDDLITCRRDSENEMGLPCTYEELAYERAAGLWYVLDPMCAAASVPAAAAAMLLALCLLIL